MTSLQNPTAIEARLDVLFAAEPKDSALISELQTGEAGLRALLLTETQRGVPYIQMTNIDVLV